MFLKRSPPTTGSGWAKPFPPIDPIPSSPLPLVPQHQALASSATAQACPGARLRVEKLCPPVTAEGVRRLVMVPSPRFPAVLSPQQNAWSAAVMPQLTAFQPSPLPLKAPTVTTRKEPDPATGVGRNF